MAVRFEIGRQIPGTNNFAEVYCSKHIKQKTCNDFDLPMVVSLTKMCNNNKDIPIRFSVWNKRDKMLNQVQLTVNDIEKCNQLRGATGNAIFSISDW